MMTVCLWFMLNYHVYVTTCWWDIKNVGIYQTQSWVVCRGSVELWVTWVMGHEYDPLSALWRSRWSCGAFDSNSGHRIYPVFLVLQNISFDKTQTRLIDKRLWASCIQDGSKKSGHLRLFPPVKRRDRFAWFLRHFMSVSSRTRRLPTLFS